MLRQLRLPRARVRRHTLTLVVAVAGFATAALVGIAVAKSFTLKIAKDASVTDTKSVTVHENVVVDARGFAVYTLSGDTAHHPKCTKAGGCFKFWPPVKVASAKKLSKAPGIKGKLGVFHRNGFNQVTLGGHPLYQFSGDKRKATAVGEGIHGFGGTWHVSKTAGPTGPATTLPPPTPGTSTMPTSTSTSTTPPTYPTTTTSTTITYPPPPY
jgi:predicted lipoprotein with Yx(FWY)xxD motif